MHSHKSLHPSSAFTLCCRTVSVDIEKGLVLVIICLKTGEYLVSKGRKDINKSLKRTATREMLEETGFPAKLLPLAIPTLATTPTHHEVNPMPGAARYALAIEPIAVSQRVIDRNLMIMFWYAAQVDSTLQQKRDTQQEGEVFKSVWIPLVKVAETPSFDNDRQIAAEVVCAIQALQSEGPMGKST